MTDQQQATPVPGRGTGIASLVLGILSFMCFGPFCSIPAVILGHLGLSAQSRAGGGTNGFALAGLILGYINIALCVILLPLYAAILLPALARAREAAIRASCANNLKQIELVLKMYSNENRGDYPPLSSEPGRLMFDADVVSPEYVTDTRIFTCPGDDGDETVIDDHSYWYLGYVTLDDGDVDAFATAYVRHEDLERDYTEDMTLEDGGTTVVRRLQEGVERFYVTDVLNPASAYQVASEIPLLIEDPSHHAPGGGNVVFMDGHVEFIKYPGEWPMTEDTIAMLRALDDD